MPRPATGQVVKRAAKDGSISYALRFRVAGRREYVTLGRAVDDWTQERAEQELQNVLADVRRGIWKQPRPRPATPVVVSDPTFHEFASRWFMERERNWEPRTADTYKGLLKNHVLPFFFRHRLSEITVAEVDRYREDRLTESRDRDRRRAVILARLENDPAAIERLPQRLSATTINKTLVLLGSILAVAEERDLISRNPLSVNPKRRKAKRVLRRPVYLDSAGHIIALLDAASALDAGTGSRTGGRRPLVATLVFAGLRLGEACALNWRDVNLADGWLYVGSKTDAGMRDVRMLPMLRDELVRFKPSDAGPDDPVFVTARGQRRRVDNARQRVVEPVIAAADRLLEERSAQPLPEGLTPHKLRHTFASILAALGTPMPEVIAQLGHTDPGFTLRVYAHTMRRDDRELERLRALVAGTVMDTGTGTNQRVSPQNTAKSPLTPPKSGAVAG